MSDHRVILGDAPWRRFDGADDRYAPVFERFMARVSPEPNTGCWLWTGTACSVGYGRFTAWGKFDRPHRVSWMLHHGPIPARLYVLHRCDNRACVNPAHLFLGTHLDNVADMAAKGRGSKPPRKRPRLAAESVAAIRRRAAAGEPVSALAAEYGVHRGYAYGIVAGRERTDV